MPPPRIACPPRAQFALSHTLPLASHIRRSIHARWWAPGDVKAVVGHRFDLDMGPWGKQACEVLAVEPLRLLKYRFATGRLDTIITWHLKPEGTGTRLTLTHEGFDLDSPMGRQSFEGMKPGWPGVLVRLETLLDA